MRYYIPLILISTTLPLLQGCIPAMVGGTAAVVGPTIAEERTLGQVVTDTEIRTKINGKWMDYDPKLHEMVELQVREGRVLLSGLLDTPQRQIDAVRLAWEVNGVKEVIDETRIGQDSLGNYANDTWITTKLKTVLLFDDKVGSLNYNIKTVDGNVYLIGIAQNQAEVEHVMQQARQVSGVKGVTNYMRIKGSGVPGYAGSIPTPEASYTSNISSSGPIQERPLSDTNHSDDLSFPNPRAN